MTDDGTAPDATRATTLVDGDIRGRPAASRRTVLAWTAGLIGPAALAGCGPFNLVVADADPYDAPGGGRGGGGSDSDPSDPVGAGRGGNVSDTDPSDPVGRGRGARSGSGSDNDPYDPGRRGYSAGRGGGGSASDSDPNDPVGRGRGSGVRSGYNPRVTDADPNDAPGRGRLRTGCTDGDSRPMDPPSAGRRCR